MDFSHRYEKFQTSMQARVKLEIALEDWFCPDLPESCRTDYEAYLRQRIVPAVESLIDREDTGKLQIFWNCGWISPQLLDRFLDSAVSRRRSAAAIWLMQRKQETDGFHRPDFSL